MISWLFLAVSLLGAALVWNVYRPVRGGSRLSALSFFTGWLIGELALHHILWQAVATVIFVALGALSSPVGWLGLVVALASWAALGLHTVRGLEARGVMDRALSEALGPDSERATRPELAAEHPRGIDWRPILMPFPIHAPGVERIRNVQYGRASAMNLRLDVYRPASGRSGCPVFFYVHGGGWTIGTKDTQGLPLCFHLASQGWVCVNVNYRLSPHATFPDHLVDLKRALAWLRREGASYGADPAFVAVSGGSAGGHLAALLALTPNDPEYQPGFESADTRVQAAVPIYGVYDFLEPGRTWHHRELLPMLERHVMKVGRHEDPEAFEKASPLHRVRPDAPPFLVIHGAADTLVPPEEAREFVQALRESSRAPVAYAEIPGAQHAFELFPSLRSQLVRNGVERFLAWCFSRHRDATRGAAAQAAGDEGAAGAAAPPAAAVTAPAGGG